MIHLEGEENGLRNRTSFMEIVFKNKHWARVCTDPSAAAKKLSKATVRTLFRRLDQLASFRNLAEVPTDPPFLRHKMRGKRWSGQWAVRIGGRNRICFRPTGDFATGKDGAVDLRTVRKIEITFVGDYHE